MSNLLSDPGSHHHISCGRKRRRSLEFRLLHRYRLPAMNRSLRWGHRLPTCLPSSAVLSSASIATRARQLILVIAWSGVAYAIYGMAAYLIDPTHLLWLEKRAYRDVLTSTFVNRNTAAVYFGSCAVLWLLIFCHELRGRLPPGRFIGEACRIGFFYRCPAPWSCRAQCYLFAWQRC